MKIRSKLFGINLIGIIALLVIGFVSFVNFRNVIHSWNKYQHTMFEKSKYIAVLHGEKGYGGAINNFEKYILRGTSEYFDAFEEKYGNINETIRAYKVIGNLSVKERESLNSLENAIGHYHQVIKRAESLFIQGAAQEKTDSQMNVDDSIYLNGLVVLSEELNRTTRQETDNFLAKINSSSLVISIIVLCTVILILFLGTGFLVTISKQIRSLISSIQNIEKTGDLSTSIPVTKDEFGALAISFNQMLKSLKSAQLEVRAKSAELVLNLEKIKEQNELLENTKRASMNVLEDLEIEKKKIVENEIKIRTIVETAVDGIVVINDRGMIDSFNRAAENIFGYQIDEVVGQNVKILMPEPYQGEHDGYLNAYMKTNLKKIIGIGREVVGRRKDGTTFPMELSVNEMDFGNRKMFAGIIRDITERKKAEEELIEQKKVLEKVNLELDSFVYTASHDLRAPLRGISSFASFLDEDYKDKIDEEGQEYIDEIRKGTDRLSNLIDDLLTLSRISRVKNPYEDVRMTDLVHTIKERIEFDIKDLNVDLKIQDDMPIVHCDRIKIGEVILNLLNNAIKFSSKNEKESPKVQFSYESEEHFHKFLVKDNGIGIAPEYHEQIFGIFKRLHKQSEFEGTGAGLSIVKRVIDDHEGNIWIESELGKGATFCFTIPKELKEKKKIGEILVEGGLISQKQLDKELKKQ